MQRYISEAQHSFRLERTDVAQNHVTYYLNNETGNGTIMEWRIFPGVMVICCDMQMSHLAIEMKLHKGVIDISYCIEGGLACLLGDSGSFIIGEGELSIGVVAQSEMHGGMQSGRYYGITIFIDEAEVSRMGRAVLQELQIDLKMISQLTENNRRRFNLRGESRIDAIFRELLERKETEAMLPLLKLKTLELLMILSEPEIKQIGVLPNSINPTHARIAAEVQRRLTDNLAGHMTIRQLEKELNISSTSIKNAFKAVYGSSPYAYFKECRLAEARRLLTETRLPIAEVGQRIGYHNPAKFSTAFKDFYGMTPSTYRREARLRELRGA